jgi:hypothetical protein
MSPRHADDVMDDAEVLAGLSRLARKGAYAVPADGPTEAGVQYAVFSSRNGYTRPFANLPRTLVTQARDRGWLDGGEGGESVRLSDEGARALRRARSTQGAPQPRPKQPQEPEAPCRPLRTAAGGTPEGPLAWLRRRKDKDGRPLVSDAQFTASERLRSDYWHGQLMPRVTANWSAPAAGKRMRRSAHGTGTELSDSVMTARERVSRAKRAVGPELWSILVDVCCHELGLQAAGREQAWPERATRVVLDLALTRLARHYGLIAPEPPTGASRVRHWGEEGYKPSLDAWR